MNETNAAGLSENVAGALAYVTLIPAIIFLLVEPYNRNSFVRFHSWQCIFLCIAALCINVALSIVLGIALAFSPYVHAMLWPLIQLAWLVIWIVCLLNAINGKRFKLPLIGDLAEKQANK